MKNNQFRAFITKHVYNQTKSCLEGIHFHGYCLSVDLNSNKRMIYAYEPIFYGCLGTISLYFTNDYVEIAYSTSTTKPCSISNRIINTRYDYCQLKEALKCIDDVISHLVNSHIQQEEGE